MPIFYDPMISKLIAWGSDRPQAIARMRRALREYDVRGIKTTVPFFRWMLDQPDFVDARFHTSYVDEVLHTRQGRLFGPDEDAKLVDIAVIAAAIRRMDKLEPIATYADPAARPTNSRGSGAGWKALARLEGLRV